MKKRYEITEKEFEVIIKAIEDTIGYCGCWDKDWRIECCSPDKHCISMCIETFITALKDCFIIKK